MQLSSLRSRATLLSALSHLTISAPQTIDGSPCSAYGFVIHDCPGESGPVRVLPGSRLRLNISFSPDFSHSRISLPLELSSSQVSHELLFFPFLSER